MQLPNNYSAGWSLQSDAATQGIFSRCSQSYLKDFNNFLNPIKILILICVKENRLVDAEYSRRIFYFSKVHHFYKKKIPPNLERNLNV